jgi:hypothetical protein
MWGGLGKHGQGGKVFQECESNMLLKYSNGYCFLFAHYIFVATYVKGMNGSECVETLSKAIPLGAIV